MNIWKYFYSLYQIHTVSYKCTYFKENYYLVTNVQTIRVLVVTRCLHPFAHAYNESNTGFTGTVQNVQYLFEHSSSIYSSFITPSWTGTILEEHCGCFFYSCQVNFFVHSSKFERIPDLTITNALLKAIIVQALLDLHGEVCC